VVSPRRAEQEVQRRTILDGAKGVEAFQLQQQFHTRVGIKTRAEPDHGCRVVRVWDQVGDAVVDALILAAASSSHKYRFSGK
jgi:hypothetical protein